MNTPQLERALGLHPKTRPIFRGCYPANRIPFPPPHSGYPHSYVINTDPSHLPGEHWVAIHFPSPYRVEYFDSLGDWPPTPLIANYLRRYTTNACISDAKLLYNRVQFQSERSAGCGKYVIHFLLERGRGRTFHEIIARLRRTSAPDRLVTAYANYHFFGRENA
jgi:hypothetical protein